MVYKYRQEIADRTGCKFPFWHCNRTDEEIFTIITNSDAITIARNPYVRFLSSYLDWLGKTLTKESEVPFDVFTDNFYELHKGNSSKKCFFECGSGGRIDHIASISKFCQIGKYNYTVLRVEEQAFWFNEFLEKYHLKEKHDRYTSYGNVLFSGDIQKDALVNDHTAQISGREPWPSKTMETTHNRGSAQKILQYYTPDIAKKVTEIVWDDLVNFGYPLWDGNAENFRWV